MQSLASQVKLCALVLGLLLAGQLSEARAARLEEQLQQLASNYQRIAEQQAPMEVRAAAEAAARQEAANSGLNNANDDDDDDDDLSNLSAASLPSQQELARAAGRLYAQQRGAHSTPGQQVALGAAGADLNAAASKHYHHHKHGAKGWLDMGAWTGKKGAFGWYDKHPVGKGK